MRRARCRAFDVRQGHAVQADETVRRLDETGETAQQAGLAGTVGADQADALPGPDVQLDAAQDLTTSVAQAKARDVDVQAGVVHSWYAVR